MNKQLKLTQPHAEPMLAPHQLAHLVEALCSAPGHMLPIHAAARRLKCKCDELIAMIEANAGGPLQLRRPLRVANPSIGWVCLIWPARAMALSA